MVDHSVGQEWPDASENSFLASKISIESDFPDPLSYYSLYSVIVQEEPSSNLPEYSFTPFKGRFRERKCLERYGYEGNERRDHMFWISTLTNFLGCPPLVQYISDWHRRVELTTFGTYIFPQLMQAFEDLYHQNDRLKRAVAAYQAHQR